MLLSSNSLKMSMMAASNKPRATYRLIA